MDCLMACEWQGGVLWQRRISDFVLDLIVTLQDLEYLCEFQTDRSLLCQHHVIIVRGNILVVSLRMCCAFSSSIACSYYYFSGQVAKASTLLLLRVWDSGPVVCSNCSFTVWWMKRPSSWKQYRRWQRKDPDIILLLKCYKLIIHEH